MFRNLVFREDKVAFRNHALVDFALAFDAVPRGFTVGRPQTDDFVTA